MFILLSCVYIFLILKDCDSHYFLKNDMNENLIGH